MKKISDENGMCALENYFSGNHDRQTLGTAVRYSLQEISKLHPGKSVEVRVPPFGATQILEGNTHRRGTPPAVVECDPKTWLDMCLGIKTWAKSVSDNSVEANGERSDLSEILPVFVLNDDSKDSE